jgi:Na+-translocating ferredoxin:NAD+ oxidoreductase subunit A
MAEQGIIGILLIAVLTQNVIFARFLGICPYLGVSKQLSTAFGMSAAVLFVMTLASALTYPIHILLLKPAGMEYLQTISFILVIASLVQLVEIVMKKTARSLYGALGIFLPLITTNCAILGVAIINLNEKLSYLQAMIFTVGSAAGFGLALIIFSGIREALSVRNVPDVMRGAPIGLITAGILAMAFMGFAGLG